MGQNQDRKQQKQQKQPNTGSASKQQGANPPMGREARQGQDRGQASQGQQSQRSQPESQPGQSRVRDDTDLSDFDEDAPASSGPQSQRGGSQNR